MKFNDTLIEIIRLELEVGAVPALIGEPGIGKSAFADDLAASMHTKAFTVPCNQLADKADLTGARLVPYELNGETKYRQDFFPHRVIQDAIDYARANPRETPILFLDEINRSTSDVTSACLSLPTARTIGSETLPGNLRLMVAGNDKGNVTALDEASLSRFSIYHVEPDAQTLIGILGDALHPAVKAVLTKYPHLVFAKSTPSAILVDGKDDDDDDTTTAAYADLLDGGEEMLQLTTPRTIDSMNRFLNQIDPATLQEYFQATTIVNGKETTVLQEVVEAHVGNTEFSTQLLSEIAVTLTTGAGQVNQRLMAPKPNCFESLKTAATVDEVAEKIKDLTDHEKSGSLLYALFERADNRVIIEQLAQQTTGFEAQDTSLLVQLGAAGHLDTQNVDVLLGTGTGIGETSKIVLGAVMVF